MPESESPTEVDGIPSLIEHWINVRVPLQGHITTQTGRLYLTGFDADLYASRDRPSDVLLEAQIVTPVPIPHDELVMQMAVIGFTDLSAHPLLVYSIATPWIEILKELERDPQFLHTIHPRKLEELIADAYRQQGYTDVILTPYSNDRGRDVIVSATLPGIGTIRIVDQVKRYSPHRKVTANDVRALAGVLLRDRDVSKGIVTTTSDFAPGIQNEFAPLMPSRIELKNGQVLKQWLSEMYSSQRLGN